MTGVWAGGGGAGAFDPEPDPDELDPVPECEPCVVDVVGWVVDAPGAVVGVAVGAAAVEAGMPLFNTANHTLPTFWPVRLTLLLVPLEAVQRDLWKATCQWPLATLINERPLTPFGPDTCAPLAARSGGQILAHAPVHVAVPLSSVKRYSVRPDAVVSTVPTPATLAVETLTVLPRVVSLRRTRPGTARTRASESEAAASPTAERVPATARPRDSSGPACRDSLCPCSFQPPGSSLPVPVALCRHVESSLRRFACSRVIRPEAVGRIAVAAYPGRAPPGRDSRHATCGHERRDMGLRRRRGRAG